MRKRFTFTQLLHNDRLMIILSLVLALILWGTVVYGPSATDKKTITVPVTVRLNSAAESGQNLPDQYFSVLSKSVDHVDVTVSGNRSVLSKLNADSLSVTADLSGIVNAVTDYEVSLDYQSNVSGAFTVTNISKNKVKVTCDYIGSNTYPVSVDMSDVSVEDETKFQLGSPVLGAPASENATVVITGPKTARDKIASVVAKVQKTENLTETAVAQATLTALDADGNELSEAEWEHCEFNELPEGEIPVTVIVQGYRKMTLKPTLINIPQAYKGAAQLVTLTPSELEFKGDPETVKAFEKQLNNLTIDFEHLYPVNGICTIALNVPDGITVIDNVNSLQVKIEIESIDTKTLEMTLDTKLKRNGTTWKSDNVTILNVPKNYDVTLTQTKLTDIVLVGNSNSISKMKAGNLSVVVDMKGNPMQGPSEYTASITVNGSQAVWVYYNNTSDQSGYKLYITASES